MTQLRRGEFAELFGLLEVARSVLVHACHAGRGHQVRAFAAGS